MTPRALYFDFDESEEETSRHNIAETTFLDVLREGKSGEVGHALETLVVLVFSMRREREERAGHVLADKAFWYFSRKERGEQNMSAIIIGFGERKERCDEEERRWRVRRVYIRRRGGEEGGT
jgi:hypothetical protein